MRNFIDRYWNGLALCVGFLVVSAAFFAVQVFSPPVRAANAADSFPSAPGTFVTGTFAGSAYADTNNLSGATSYTVQSTAIPLPRMSGFSVFAIAGNTNATTGSNVISANLSVSYDGTTFCDSGLALTLPCYVAPVSTNRYWTNFPPALLNNARYVRLETITATNDTYKTKITVRYGFWNTP